MIDLLLDGLAWVLATLIGVVVTRVVPALAALAADQLLVRVLPIVVLALLMIGIYYVGARLGWWRG